MSINSVILPLLNERPRNISDILSKLHYSSLLIDAKNTESVLLGRRTLNYLQSKDDGYLIWVGCCLVKVICANPLILSTFASDYLSTLIKLLGLPPVFNNDELFDVVANTILTLCLFIKGKPSLTRETLTPNIPGFIMGILKKIEQANDIEEFSCNTIYNCICILTILSKNHPTIFRPFGTKYEMKLNRILSSSSFNTRDSEFQQKVIESYVSLCSINKNPALQYRFLMNNIINEMRGMFELFFQHFIQLDDEDSNKIMNKINTQLSLKTDFSLLDPQHKKNILKFPPLKIDVNELTTLGQIYERIDTLIQILIGLITTPFGSTVIRFPIGVMMIICEILSYISSEKYEFHKELLIGNLILKENLELVFFKMQLQSIYLLRFLVQTFGQNCLKYSTKVFQILDNVIPTETITSMNPNTNKTSYKKILNISKISQNKHDLLVILEATTDYLNILDKGDLHDFSIVLKTIDMAIIINEQETFEKVLEKQSNKANSTKQKKVKNSVELADVLANPLLLKIKPNVEILSKTLCFFNTLLKNVPKLPLAQLIKIEKFAVSETIGKIANNEQVSDQYISLLTTLVIYSNENEKYSILPITISLLKLANQDNNELISLLLNPRLSIVNKCEVEYFDKSDLEKEENARKEELQSDNESMKIYTEMDLQVIKEKLELSTKEQVNQKFNELKRKFFEENSKEDESKRRKKIYEDLKNEEIVWSEKKGQIKISNDKVLQKESEVSRLAIVPSKSEKTVEIDEIDTAQQEDEDADIDIELEMPNIDIGSSDDDE